MRAGHAKQQTYLDTCAVVQDVERECAAACALLASPCCIAPGVAGGLQGGTSMRAGNAEQQTLAKCLFGHAGR